MASLREYLFVDIRRLRSYYEQIAGPGSMLKAQKATAWELSAGISGLGIKRGEVVTFRDPTVFEMLSAVEGFIRNSDSFVDPIPGAPLLASHEWPAPPRPTIFSEVTYEARKAVIPPSLAHSLPGIDHLCVWVPEPTVPAEGIVTVYLIEASPQEDKDHVEMMSGYSGLELLVQQASGLDTGQMGTRLRDRIAKHRRMGGVRATNEFANDPFLYLEQFGASVTAPRRINTLFRWRTSFIDMDYSEHGRRHAHGILGYPVYVALA